MFCPQVAATDSDDTQLLPQAAVAAAVAVAVADPADPNAA